MSRRGDITIECDCKDCQAEQVITADELWSASVCAVTSDWDVATRNRDVCPQCQEEIDDGTRCDRCLTKLEDGALCGDCYGGTERDPQARSLETAEYPFARNH